MGDKYSLGRVHAAQGSLYLRRNQTSEDRELAREHIAKAREVLTALGARNDLDRLPEA